MSIKTNRIVVNGKIYKMQHPGNREWMKIQGTMVDPKTQTYNMIDIMDYCFEHVVIPEKGNKLDLDSVDTRELSEVWQVVCPLFLRGQLDTGYVYPEDKQSKKSGQKLLQENS